MGLLVISSNLSPRNKCQLLAREAERVLHQAGHETALLDLARLPLPLQDVGTALKDPNVAAANRLIQPAAGIIIATPIYNYDANAALKNLIELTGGAWENKVVAFLCAAGGQAGFMSIMPLANSLMLDFRCVIVPRFVYATGSAFSADGITDAEIAARIAQCAHATARLAAALQTGQ